MEPVTLLSETLKMRRVGSPYCLAAAASLIFLSVFLLSTSLNPPKLSPLLQIHPVGGWAFPFSASPASSSLPSAAAVAQGVILNQTQPQNVSVVAAKVKGSNAQQKLEAKGDEVVSEKKTPSKDPAQISVNGSPVGNESNGGNYYPQVESPVSSIYHKNENATLPGSTICLDNSSAPVGVDQDRPTQLDDVGSLEDCDIFDGEWVRDDSKPYYPQGSCPYIDRDFDCHLNGRPDGEYMKWRWKPNKCDIPTLNSTDFLKRLQGKKLVFVGDSLNRNMWESLVCILRHSIKNKKRVFEISGRREFKKKGFYAFRFEDYNCSVDFVSAPFIVRESSFKGINGSIETLRLDLMDRTTSMYHDADIIIFNTGHWWTHEKTSRGEDYYQEGNHVHPRLKVMEAYKRALYTWAKWVDKNIDSDRTQVFFRGFSVTHFRRGQWNTGGQCHKESEPIFNEKYLKKYPSKMKVLEYVLRGMKTRVNYLNISRLTAYRKDAHPSIYRMLYKTEEDRVAAEKAQDCSHWCLPGVPDTWNELLYASLLKSQWKP